MIGVKFVYVSVDYSVCFACCVFDDVGELFVECVVICLCVVAVLLLKEIVLL